MLVAACHLLGCRRRGYTLAQPSGCCGELPLRHPRTQESCRVLRFGCNLRCCRGSSAGERVLWSSRRKPQQGPGGALRGTRSSSSPRRAGSAQQPSAVAGRSSVPSSWSLARCCGLLSEPSCLGSGCLLLLAPKPLSGWRGVPVLRRCAVLLSLSTGSAGCAPHPSEPMAGSGHPKIPPKSLLRCLAARYDENLGSSSSSWGFTSLNCRPAVRSEHPGSR